MINVLAAGLSVHGATPIAVVCTVANPVPCLVYDDASGKRRGCYVLDGRTLSAAYGCEPDLDRSEVLIDWRVGASERPGDAA